MKRRTALLGSAVAVTAVGLGISTAKRWQWRSADRDDEDEADVDVWALSFATLEGPPLAMASLRGKPLLINFWATWCVPCVTEMPLLEAFLRSPAAAGWNLLALAVDSAPLVRRFRDERKLDLPMALAGTQGLTLSRQLGNTAGGLPFSVALGADGGVVGRKLGPVDERLLRSWVAPKR